MAAFGELVHETSSSTGAGSFALEKVNSRRRFSDEHSTGGSDVFNYYIVHANVALDEWEYGTGSLSDAGTLVRDTVIASSNSGAAVDFSIGTKDVTNDLFASDVLTAGGTSTLSNKTIALGSNTVSGTIAEFQTAVTDATLLTTADEGSGNGIDADTVDGSHASDFASASHTHAAGDVASGTFADARIAASNVTQHQASITGLGTIASGTWQGTSIAVSYGGTGTSSLTDGGVLLGSGTGAITAMSVLADGAIVVGDGAGDPVSLTAFSSSTGNLLAAKGGTIGKQTIWVPAAAMVAATTSGAASGQVEEATNAHNYSTLDFDASADEYACFEIAFPKGWDEGTVTFIVYWSSTAADTDGVSWALQGVAVSDNENSDVAYGTAIVVDDANQGAAGELLVAAESSAVTIAGTPAAGDLVQFRIFRDVSDANDTATEDAQLRGVKILYTIDAGADD